MKKIRKAIALLLGMVMVLSLMPQMVMAEKTDDSYMYGWYISGPEQNDNIKAYIDGNDSVSGSNSLYIQKNDQNWSDFSVDQNVTIPAGTYTLSLWVKGGYEDATTVLLEGGHWQTHRFLNSEYTTGTEFTRTEGENGWAKLEKTLTVDSENSRIRILTVGWANGFYVDDVRLVKEGTTDNLISNGSFDMRAAPYTADLEAYYQNWTRWDNGAAPNGVTRYASVTNEIAHSGNNSLIVKHQTTEGGMMVVQEGLNLTGTYTLSFWSIGLKSGKQIYVMQGQDGLWQGVALVGNNAIVTEKDGEWTKYTLELTVPEGHTQTGMVLCSDGETEGWYLDDISIVPQGSTTNVIKNGSFDFDKVAEYSAELEPYFYGWGNWSAAALDHVNTFYCVTDEIAHSGNNSVVIKHTDGNQNWKAVTIAQDVIYGPGDYTLSFWAAGTYANNLCGMTRNGSEWDDYYINDFAVAETDGDWTKYSVDFTISGENNAITLMSNGDTQCLYVDDISLVKQGTTNNLLANASFEKTEAEPEVPTGPVYTTEFADYFYGWSDWSAVEKDGNLVFMCVTDEDAHSGNHSFILKHVDGSKTSNICLAQNVPSLAAGDYTISFWSKGVANNGLQGVTLADPWRKYSMEQFSVTATDGDWKKYELTVTADGGETAITFMTDGQTEGWYLDEISLVKVGTTNNLITNASFEEKAGGEEPDVPVVPEEPTGPKYTTEFADYFYAWNDWSAVEKDGNLVFMCVTDEDAHSGNHSFILKHVDGSKPSNICIAQNVPSLTAGEYTISFWAKGTTTDGLQAVTLADPWKRFPVTDFQVTETDGEWKKYEKTVTADGGETAISFPTDGNTEGWFIDDISLVKVGTTNNLIRNAGFEFKGIPTYTTKFADYFYNWDREYGIEENGNTIFACVTDEIAHSGNYSYVLRSLDTGASDLLIKQTGLGLGEGTYTLTFWAAGTVADWDDDTYKYQQIVWIPEVDPGYHYVTNMTTGEKDGDWSKYSFTFTVPAGKTVNEVKLSTRGHGTEGLFVDDFSIVKEGTTNNLLTNGGFEDDGIPDYKTEFEQYFTNWEREAAIAENGSTIFTCVTNEIAHSGNNSFLLRSLDTGANDLMIKQTGLGLGEGTYRFSFWATGTVADGDDDPYRYQQIVWLDGLDPSYRYVTDMTTSETDGDWRKYVLEFTVPAGSTVNAIKLSTRGHGTAGLYVDDFSLEAMGDNTNLLKNGSFEIDGVPEYTTEFEAYFTGWSDWSAEAKDGRLTFLCVTNEAAHSGNNSFVIRHVDGSKPSNLCLAQNVPSLEAGQYTISFWSQGVANNGLQAVTLADPWKRYPLEQFTVTETDGDWKKYELTVTADGGETALTFPTDGGTEAWFIDDVSLVKVGTTNNLVSNGSFELKSLKGYYISTPKVVKIDGENRKELTALEAGNLEVSVEITNYSMGENFAPVLIVALYEGGNLKSMEYIQQNADESALEGFLEDELCFTVEVPEMTAGTDYQLKVMCWKDWSTLTPLVDALELE